MCTAEAGVICPSSETTTSFTTRAIEDRTWSICRQSNVSRAHSRWSRHRSPASDASTLDPRDIDHAAQKTLEIIRGPFALRGIADQAETLVRPDQARLDREGRGIVGP